MTAFPVRLKATCLAFLFGASAAIAAETGMVAPSGDASGVVRVGLVDTFTPLKSSKAPTNYFTPNILRKSWSRLVVSVVHLDALAFPVAAT